MRLLTAVDQLFLILESRSQPMHVGGLFLFELPVDADKDFVYQLVHQMQTSTVLPTFPFNQVLDKLAFWKNDKDFDVDHHFRHLALPKPARMRELLVYISQEHGRLLDRAKPLWECHIIEGIEPESTGKPERFALYFKIHHSLVDGIAAMRLIQKSLSQSPNEIMSLPVWSLMTRHRNQVDALLPIHKPFLQLLKEQIGTIKPVYRELKKSFLERNNPDYISTTQAPASILNQRISGSRRLVAQSYSLKRFIRIARILKVSLNDVVLAVCAGALRQYLLGLNALPKKPLIAFVPISLRQDDSIHGNQVSFILANLGTNLEEPLARIKTIHRSMNNGKQRFGRMNQAQVINYSGIVYSWAGLNLLTKAFPQKQAFNIIISNVPGSTKPLYWNGAPLKALYPASIVLNGQAMNITLSSYLNKIEFGITACSQILPDVENMLTLLTKELETLEVICDEKAMGWRE
ncbi:WS/DGAT/MGAT family O-acyltransferase [Psychrobacter sp. I-STPA6b]|uniref:WS/DGAT/MGAT family O-acyltransferase n=1 Tax=Psychrobacter sp. I-STPA6b TaxID=2585718 RepID=UPI001D0CBEFD|nr:wax ester/triacylglycerol synthase family O-acyltransferase [Psychrobacter sp. I-STPA6b]